MSRSGAAKRQGQFWPHHRLAVLWYLQVLLCCDYATAWNGRRALIKMSESMDNVKLSESHESLSTELAALQDKLDTLWERYLVQLDLYDHAQRKLSKQLSAVGLACF